MTSGSEAGLHSHLRHSTFALSFYLASPFASLASVVYVGWDLMVRYLCYEACWPVLERFGIFLPAFKYFFCDLSQDKSVPVTTDQAHA